MKCFRLYFIVLAALSLTLVTSCELQQQEPKAKYVFLFIGDGMGISQVTTAEKYQANINGKDYEPLGFSKFPHTGFSTTFANNRFITASAAAGTALSTGYKTNIGRISMDVNADSALVTIAEKVKEKGMKVGIITSVSLDHATPAAFYAHQPNRNMYHEISLDLASSNFDFFGGGGLREPVRDDVNTIELAEENGFRYINDEESFMSLKPADEKILFVNPELTNGSAMLYAIDQAEDYITLADITQKAIEYLDNDNGFFMMVEGGKIDWLSHANDAGAMVHEVIDFAEAVDVAVKFYHEHPDETLIVVTADHETGGLSVGCKKMEYDTDYSLLQYQKMSGDNFNELLAHWRKENHLNNKGFKKMLEVLEESFGIGEEGAPIELTPEEMGRLNKAFTGLDLSQEGDYSDYSPLTVLSTNILANHAGLGWTSNSHTGVSVPVFAIGVNGEAFSGYTDNTDIPKLIWETID